MHELTDNNNLDGDIQPCSECLQAFDISINNDQWGTTECLYTEDLYCSTCLIEHNRKYHHFYYTKVMERKTQHKARDIMQCMILVNQFLRRGHILVPQNSSETNDKYIYWVNQTYGKQPKFQYYEMDHDDFVTHYYQNFIQLKGRDDTQAGREEICK